MRLDKFLKVTRIIKRRTIATELAGAGKVLVDGVAKKPSYEVKKGDKLEVSYYNNTIKVNVIDIPLNNVKKEDIENYIEITKE